MRYIDLINIGFERYELNCSVTKDTLGIDDFYLTMTVSKDITFEWYYDSPNSVRMIRYKKENVQEYILIEDIEILKTLIHLYKSNTANSGVKKIIKSCKK